MGYDELPELLGAEIPGFQASPELALVADDLDLPGVIVAAVSRYLVRLEQSGGMELDGDPRNAIYKVFERMATSPDREVQNALQVEVFENLDPSRSVTRRILSRLGPEASALWAAWADPS